VRPIRPKPLMKTRIAAYLLNTRKMLHNCTDTRKQGFGNNTGVPKP
jgi:hypothetical protein